MIEGYETVRDNLEQYIPAHHIIARAAEELADNWDAEGECEIDFVNALRAALAGEVPRA